MSVFGVIQSERGKIRTRIFEVWNLILRKLIFHLFSAFINFQRHTLRRVTRHFFIDVTSFNPFYTTDFFLYPWKHRKLLVFLENVCSGERKRPEAWNGLSNCFVCSVLSYVDIWTYFPKFLLIMSQSFEKISFSDNFDALTVWDMPILYSVNIQSTKINYLKDA